MTLLVAAPLAAFAKNPPPPEEIGGATAVISKDPDNATLDVSQTQTWRGDTNNSNHHSPTNPIANIPVTPKPPKPTHPFDNRCVEWTSLDECLRLTPKDVEPTEDGITPATPAFSITDLASFAPAPATLTGEPNNLGVAGLPTNFTTTATTHTRNGTLFGYPLTARFTPKTFTFHYGDTTTRTSTTSGNTWEHLHLPQFTPTDTSHTYTERGTYTAHANTTYTAEIDLGTGWIPITGTLTITGTTQHIHIYEAHTALVAHTCTENPTAPGC
ncbi:hypothetical protein [Microbacterium sp. W4I4]|uniref:hypothetical protein n=1 Tax=Microbacterium sp. W4I4 TaxID=3042295 RepID=UPI0027D7EB24|nr:hypothetical protein [Microbacterium sp. W4I4]